MDMPSQVQQLIETRVHAGQLPYTSLYEVFGRRGDGLACACCDELITSQQIEYDVELPSAMGAVTTLPMHVFCYQVWHQACAAARRCEHACSQSVTRGCEGGNSGIS